MGSFRQLLLVAFLLIAALLGGTALRAVVILDRLMAQSSREAERSLELNAAAQALAAHAIAMERAARQSLILNDQVLRTRFNDESRNASAALDRMIEGGLAPQAAAPWRSQLAGIADALEGSPATALARERNVAGMFRELDAINTGVASAVQASIEDRNRALRERLNASRERLTQQVVVAIGISVALAFGLGIWLARPFRRLEAAIVELGEDRLTQPIDIEGPSDVRAVSQRLEWLRLRLTELDADKARFLRHVSHELKTPLAAMREGVALLEDGVAGKLTSEQREVAGILHQNTLALQRQIEALLRFNAAAFEARQLRRTDTDLLALLEAQVEAQRLQFQAHGLTVRIEGTALVAPVDAEKIGTAVANVLSNAIRFSPAGGAIRVALSAAPGLACIEISDQGPGIAQAERERVFEPFFRGERQPKNAVPGTGIGLSIVREYIAAHGGKVGLSSDSQGARFRIEIPHAS
jgi:two-component system, NtrC family, sensor histidine kinase GlrK